MAEDEVFGIEFIVGSNISQFSKDVAAAGLTIQNLNTKVDALNASMKKSLFVNQLGANLKSSGFNTTMVTANQAFVEFGKNLEKATRIIDKRGVKKISGLPSGRSIFQVFSQSTLTRCLRTLVYLT